MGSPRWADMIQVRARASLALWIVARPDWARALLVTVGKRQPSAAPLVVLELAMDTLLVAERVPAPTTAA